jgi:hypothetical protein
MGGSASPGYPTCLLDVQHAVVAGKTSQELAYGITSRSPHRLRPREHVTAAPLCHRLAPIARRQSVAQKMRQLNRNIRAVFDYLHMTRNSSAARVVVNLK